MSLQNYLIFSCLASSPFNNSFRNILMTTEDNQCIFARKRNLSYFILFYLLFTASGVQIQQNCSSEGSV